MSQSATVQAAIFSGDASEKKHRQRVMAGWIASMAFVAAFAAYGLDYYTLGSGERPFSPKHALLRPSGAIGVNLGVFGVLLFFLIYLYPLRKKWGWRGRQGHFPPLLGFLVPLGRAVPVVYSPTASLTFQ